MYRNPGEISKHLEVICETHPHNKKKLLSVVYKSFDSSREYTTLARIPDVKKKFQKEQAVKLIADFSFLDGRTNVSKLGKFIAK